MTKIKAIYLKGWGLVAAVLYLLDQEHREQFLDPQD